MRGQNLTIYSGGTLQFNLTDGSLATGQPGIGIRATPTGNSMSHVDLSVADTIPPSAVDPQTISSSVQHNLVEMQWQGVVDNTGGSGLLYYQINRNGVLFKTVPSSEFADATVSASSTYSYTIYAVDQYLNVSSPATVTINTPTTGAVDPRRVGIRPTGAYWGAAGEQIDLPSGNLNFRLPLVKAQGRGSTVPLGLSYNSQLWRQDSGGIWKLGRDVGYGFGWKLQAGSLTPYWSDYATLHHWTFTDGSGAEYRLDVSTSQGWVSREGIYLTYEPASQRLYFPDGSFWVFDVVSQGTEPDAGMRYPSLAEDSNGNQIKFRYLAGRNVAWSNSSARLQEIEDVRAVQSGSTWRTYNFTYNTDSIPHLTQISNSIGTPEAYSFTYLANQTLYSPFSGTTSFGTAHFLQTATVSGIGLTHTFNYLAGGSGELTKVTLPYGGWLRWAYRNFTYLGNRTLREVQYRYLKKDSAATETTYTFTRYDSWDQANGTGHIDTWLLDPIGREKLWVISSSLGASDLGLLWTFEERPGAGQTATRLQGFTWAQDAVGNPYIMRLVTTLDPGQTYQQQTAVEQTLDTHGNVTQALVYDYGSPTPLTRTTTQSYLSTTNYTSRYIYNRLLSSNITDGTQTVALVTNSYDGTALTNVTGLRQHDTANYGVGMTYRGNATQSSVPGKTAYLYYDITGAAIQSTDGQGPLLST